MQTNLFILFLIKTATNIIIINFILQEITDSSLIKAD